MGFSHVWRRDWVCDGSLSFLFFFPSFLLVALLHLVSFTGFCFVLFRFLFFFFVFFVFYLFLPFFLDLHGLKALD